MGALGIFVGLISFDWLVSLGMTKSELIPGVNKRHRTAYIYIYIYICIYIYIYRQLGSLLRWSFLINYIYIYKLNLSLFLWSVRVGTRVDHISYFLNLESIS